MASNLGDRRSAIEGPTINRVAMTAFYPLEIPGRPYQPRFRKVLVPTQGMSSSEIAVVSFQVESPKPKSRDFRDVLVAELDKVGDGVLVEERPIGVLSINQSDKREVWQIYLATEGSFPAIDRWRDTKPFGRAFSFAGMDDRSPSVPFIDRDVREILLDIHNIRGENRRNLERDRNPARPHTRVVNR